jgi:Flp pilus assembly protein TadB
MMMADRVLPPTRTRVKRHTAPEVNARIVRDTRERVRRYAHDPAAAQSRLQALDREWDTERTLEALAGSFVATGAVLALTGSRRWALLPALVGAFLLQHAVQGWCPPLPVIRRLGVRTADEIEAERTALEVIP